MQTVTLPLVVLGWIHAASNIEADRQEKAIRSLESQERGAVLAQDATALDRLWSDEYAVNNPLNQITPTKNDVLERVRKGLIHFSSYEREIELIRVKDDLAVVMGRETVLATGATPLPRSTIRLRFTHVWKKDGDTTWRVLARHASIIPG